MLRAASHECDEAVLEGDRLCRRGQVPGHIDRMELLGCIGSDKGVSGHIRSFSGLCDSASIRRSVC